jgi:hypothetical protein
MNILVFVLEFGWPIEPYLCLEKCNIQNGLSNWEFGKLIGRQNCKSDFMPENGSVNQSNKENFK